MHACSWWNIALLCSEKKDMHSVVKELEQAVCIICHGSWRFTLKTLMHKDSILFDKQEVLSTKEWRMLY